MKRNFINISLAAALLFASSCGKEFLDVNTDPNNPSTSPPQLVFPAAVVSTASAVGGDYAIVGGIWSQYWTQSNSSNQYKDIDAFSLQSTNFQNRWTELYAGALNDYKYIREQANATGNSNLNLMATVMEAYTYQVLTDLYGDIPFTEALQGAANLTPAYDPGEKVYDGLIARLDDALLKATGGAATASVADNDIVFGGDMGQWIEFANTLKLKLFLRQSEARPGVAQTGVTSLFSNPMFLEQSAAIDIFTDIANQRNPLFEQDQSPALNTNQNLRASNTLLSFLTANSDPRAAILYLPPSGGGALKGMEQATFSTSSIEMPPASISRARISPTAPVYFISEPESYFLQAEAVVRYGVAGDAKALYEEGIRASFRQMADLSTRFPDATLSAPTPAQANALIAGAYAFPTTGSTEQKIEAIITQKWAALAGTTQGIEAFFERNRTGFPRTSAVPRTTSAGYVPSHFIFPVEAVTNAGQFGRRLLTPENEIQRNPNAAATLKPITTKIWWAKETL